MTRHIIVVDLETNGLDPDRHIVLEVAWWNLATDQRGHFIPPHDVDHALTFGDSKALALNGYRSRIIGQPQRNGYPELLTQLRGNTFAGSNPAFDARFVQEAKGITAWHHRLFDLSAYAAGVLGFSPDEGLPGLAAVAERLDIEPVDPHTAAGDVDTTGRCFLELFRRAGVSL